MKKVEIKFIGKDSHGRDVYKTKKGNILKNMNLDGVPTKENLATALDNEFDGEPDIPLIYKKEEYVFNVVEKF